MIKDKINIYKNINSLSEGFTLFIKEEIQKYQGEYFNVSLSGGTTPKVIFEHWSKKYAGSLPWSKIVFFWGDERCVPPDDSMSNYGMTKEALFNKIAISPNNIYRIHGEADPEQESIAYSKVLNDRLQKKNNIPAFDLVVLGLGDDGHTVSIFPSQIELWDDNRNCVVAKHPESGMERVSITGKIVDNAEKVVFLVTGIGKAEKVRDIIKNRNLFLELYPAAKVNPRNQEIYWFMDEAAASLL